MTLAILLLVLWTAWLLFLNAGNLRLQRRIEHRWQEKPAGFLPVATWLLPFRNEAANIQRFKSNLSKTAQSSFLWINDNSTDSGTEALEESAANLIQNKGRGKKAALITGWQHQDREWSLHTDADVDWTDENMAEWNKLLSQVPTHTVLVAGLPKLIGFSLDTEDFRAQMFTAGGMAGWGMPFLCSGAALAIRSNRLSKPLRPWLGPGISGDDVFLLHRVLSTFGPAAVETLPCPWLTVRGTETLGQALRQRVRWAGKSILYQNPVAISVSLFIFGIHLTGLVFLCMPGNPLVKLLLIATKALADALLSGAGTKKMGPRLLLSLLYWLYIPILPLLAWLVLPWRQAKKVW